MSRVRVNQGKSVLHEGQWYDQRAEFECPDPKIHGDAVTVLNDQKVKNQPETPKDTKGGEK